jgi:hypothetical protein
MKADAMPKREQSLDCRGNEACPQGSKAFFAVAWVFSC